MNPKVIELRIYPDKNEKLTIPSEYRSDVLYGANENRWLSRYTVKGLCRMIELQHWRFQKRKRKRNVLFDSHYCRNVKKKKSRINRKFKETFYWNPGYFLAGVRVLVQLEG